jgi:4-amino-4-deoxy-L-arabinose transferase-like glycosyltransferase
MKLALIPAPRFTYLVSALFVCMLLVGNHSTTLWDEDEAAYAGFGTEMVQTGNWVNPQFKYSTIHRKTPLHFWSIAVSYQIFGVNEFALRMPSVLAILLTCWLLFLLGKPIFGVLNAKRAAFILASSVVLPLMAKIAFTDATLLCFSTLAVLSLFNYLYQPHWKYNTGLWIGIAGGVLTKGPPIIILVGGIWLLLALFHTNRKRLIGTHPWFFGPVALLPFAGWCYASYSQDYALWESTGGTIPFSDWWQTSFEGKKIYLLPFLWDWYVLRRIGGNVLGQTGFPGYHFVVLTIAFFTWLPFWLSGVGTIFKKIKRPTALELLLIVWMVIGWLFWELMSSKLPSYSMGAQPAIALWLALQIEKIEKEGIKWTITHKIGWGIYGLVFLLIIIGVPITATLIFEKTTLWYTIPMSLVLSYLFYRVWGSRHTINLLFQNMVLMGLGFLSLIWLCIGPIIEQTPIKAFDDVIARANKMSGNEPSRFALVGLNHKQLKISLFVYAQQAFGEVEELTVKQAVEAYQASENIVLVIGHEQWENVQQQLKLEYIALQPTQIDYWSTDDQLRSQPFYLVTNR